MASYPFPSLTAEELEALENLDKSIKIHEYEHDHGQIIESDDEDKSVNLTDDEENTITVSVPQSFQPFKLPAIPESRETEQNDSSSSQRRTNSGYILYDGSEIKYVSSAKTAAMDSLRGTSTLSSEKDSSVRSRASTATHTSDIPVNFYLSAEELLDCDYLSRNRKFSVTHYNRLPTNSHFSLREKLYFFLIGLACVISFSAVLVSVNYFKPLLGNHVLSIIGSCHHGAALVAMTIVFFGKKTWFPFIPTVIPSLLLMAGAVALLPILEASRASYPVYVVYGLVVVNGLCCGLALAATDRMVLLFPGGKSCMLFRWGSALGYILPALTQLVLIVIDYQANDTDIFVSKATMNIYIIFGIAFLGIFLGIMAALLVSRRGVYKLFVDKEHTRHNVRCKTLSTSRTLREDRCSKIAVLLLAEFLVCAVTWYCLSVTPLVHSKTLTHGSSNKEPFWKHNLTTVIIGLYQIECFFGMVIGTFSRCCCKALPKWAQSVIHFTLAFLRLGFVAAVVVYIREPFLVNHNIFVLLLFLVLAITHGGLLIGMATQSQSTSGMQNKDLCPIISQTTWLIIELGAVAGAAVSFVPLIIT